MLFPDLQSRGYRTPGRHRELGVTLIEIIVSIALLGLLAGLVGLALYRSTPAPFSGSVEARVATARREALRSGQPVSLNLAMGGRVRLATAFPDGSVLADSALGTDRLSGSSVETAERRYARAARDPKVSRPISR